MRKFNRKNHEIREISINKDISINADGSCEISFGSTKVLCTASFEKDVPHWLKNQGKGWVTAEYGMLPGSTSSRNKRESRIGKQSGRTVEIQRLIGRSLRNVIDLKKLDGYQFIIDCDVIQADGGTRTASISGAYVALSLAIEKLIKKGELKENPIIDGLSAISCGIVDGNILVDLDYDEDSRAEVDANFVFSRNLGICEVQVSGEKGPFQLHFVNEMIKLGLNQAEKIFKIQEEVINSLD